MLFFLKFLPLLSRAKSIVPFLMGNWKLAISGVLLIVLLFMSWSMHGKNNRIEQQRDRITLVESYLLTCQNANETNQSTITSLRLANGALADAVRVSDDARSEAVRAAQERERRSALELGETMRELQELENESLTCNEYMQIDIGAVCPLTIDRLREHAATASGDNH